MHYHRKTSEPDDEDRIEDLRIQLRTARRFGDPDGLVPGLRAEIAALRDASWVGFESAFDTSRFTTADDRLD